MTVASRAVAMAVMTEARAVDVEQEGRTSHWVDTLAVVWLDTAAREEVHAMLIHWAVIELPRGKLNSSLMNRSNEHSNERSNELD